MRAILVVLATIVTAAICIDRGNPCVLSDGRNGRCVLFKECPSAEAAIQRQERPILCGFEGKTPVVCCERQFENLKVSKSDKACNEYYKELPPASTATTFPSLGVVGGEDTLAREFPHMAALGFGDINDVKWHCGGSLISENFVLTAAHCLFSRDLGDVKFVRLGDLNLKLDTDDAEPQTIGIKRRIKHPKYTSIKQYHDIALVELEKPADFTAHVRPACLHTTRSFPELGVIATGWGKLGIDQDQADHLQKVILKLVDFDACKKVFDANRRLPNGIENDTQICAGEIAKDTCQGDSGGPLQIYNTNRVYGYTIVGITSFGKACGIANTPGVYTRVHTYINWIESIVWQN